MKKKLSKIIIQLALLAVFLELGLLVVTKLGYLAIEEPLYTLGNAKRYWVERDTTFGVWHPDNYEFRHKKACFDVSYVTNAIGARDHDRDVKASKKRMAVIGDSFAEGWGVNVGDRFSNKLEERLGIEFMNFGVGATGMTQQLLIYQTKAAAYEHDAVLWTLFPMNDIVDDDIAYHEKYSSDRYKAYWVGEYPDYQLEHGLSSLAESEISSERVNVFKRLLKNFSYTYNFVRFLMHRKQVAQKVAFDPRKELGYFKVTQAQWNRVRFNVEKMKALLGERKLYIMTIPSDITFGFFEENTYQLPFRDSLVALSKELDFEYYDFLSKAQNLDSMARAELYLGCDGHWTAKGHQLAAVGIDSAFNLSKPLR